MYEDMNKKKTKSQLTEIEKFCLDAYLVNKDADMCFTLSRKRTLTATPENVHRLALRWLRNDFVKDYLSERQAMLNQVSSSKQKENGNRTKEQLIDELNILASSTADPKTRTDILLKLADMAGMKKEETKSEDTTIHFYMPLVCHQCELYQQAKEANRKK